MTPTLKISYPFKSIESRDIAGPVYVMTADI